MRNKLQYKIFTLLFLAIGFLSFAQSVPPPPDGSESGDVGGGTTSGNVPVDDYVLALFVIGLFIILHKYYKLKKQTY